MKTALNTRHKWRTKKPIKVAYRWKSFMDPLPGEDPKKWTEAELTPHFMHPGCKPIEDWTLEKLRRKFFIDLKGAKDYQIDTWMPKALLMLALVMKRQMLPLDEVSVWLGLPKKYLTKLCRRDPAFRRLVIHWRLKAYDMKADIANGALLAGERSFLERIEPHHSAEQRHKDYVKPYAWNVDVGWKPRVYSRKL